MPRFPPFDRPATYDDLVALPDLYIAEIVNHELYGTRRLPPLQGIASSGLGMLLGQAFVHDRTRPDRWHILFAVEIHLEADVLVPDWSGWTRLRMPTLGNGDFLTMAPDWICEVLTPDTVVLDRVKKLAIYAREGVRYAWILDPAAKMLEVLRLENGRWTILGTHIDDEVVRAEPFQDIELSLNDLWAG